MIRALIIVVESQLFIKMTICISQLFFIYATWTSGRTQSVQHSTDGPLVISCSVTPWGSVSVAERCEVWLPEPSWFYISCSSIYLITQWPDRIWWWAGTRDASPGGARLYISDLKRKNISNLPLGLVGSLVLRGWLVQSAGVQMSSAQIVAFSQVSCIYLFLLLWLFLLTWLLQG